MGGASPTSSSCSCFSSVSHLPTLLKVRSAPRQPSPGGLGLKMAEPTSWPTGPSVSPVACKLFFCFPGFTNMVLFHVTAISGAVNIAGGLFKKASDLKCCNVVAISSSPPPPLLCLNCLQEAGLLRCHGVSLNSLSLALAFPFVLSRAGLAMCRCRDKDSAVESRPRHRESRGVQGVPGSG